MKSILKPIFEWLIDGYALFDNILFNYIAIGIVGFIAYSVAWNIVGSLYRSDIINGRICGSVLHWVIRLITFFIFFSFVSVLFRVIALIVVVPLWIWAVIVCLLTIGIIIFLIIRKK